MAAIDPLVEGSHAHPGQAPSEGVGALLRFPLGP